MIFAARSPSCPAAPAENLLSLPVGSIPRSGNHVIHLTRWWNPAVEDQCTDRVYRIGQERPVTVYYPMAIYPDDEEHSFDLRLHQLLKNKRQLSRDILLPPSASNADITELCTAPGFLDTSLSCGGPD